MYLFSALLGYDEIRGLVGNIFDTIDTGGETAGA